MTPAIRSGQKDKMSKSEVVFSFVACPRCSYFLSSYRLLHDDFDSAVNESAAGWLNLHWDHGVRLLVQKSFGSHNNMELETFEGICPECRRPYAYQKLDPEIDATSFKVKIVP